MKNLLLVIIKDIMYIGTIEGNIICINILHTSKVAILKLVGYIKEIIR